MNMRLRKLYLDCIGDDSSVCIAYVSELAALGMRIQPAGIEHYDAAGGHAVRRGRALLSLASEPNQAALADLSFAFGERTCVIEIEPEQGAIEVASTQSPAPTGLQWNVKLARARIRIRNLRSAGDELVGTGYSDWVELTRSPRALGLLQLEWGRVHLEGGSVIYTAVERSHGPAFRSATFWPRAGAPHPIETFALEHDAKAGTRLVRLSAPAGSFEIELTALRELHQGSAVDGARFPSWIERTLSRAVAGPTHESRWLSCASCAELGTGFAVHESVRFGARAQDAEDAKDVVQ